jgi:nucleoside-diphosphate-sugar epimerase
MVTASDRPEADGSTEIEIKGRRVAVTGAAGFIGAAVAQRLASEGAEVVGIEVSPELASRVSATGAEARVADISDPGAITEALSDAEMVVHTAAFVREWGPMKDFIRVNVEGTANVLDAAEVAGNARVVQISSVVVFGYADTSHQDESAFRRNMGVPYVDTKSASDRIAARRGAVIVRPGDVYGPGSLSWVVRPVELMRSRRFAVPGKGDGTMLPIYVDDLVTGILAALRRGRPGSAYAVWDGEGVQFSDYFRRLAQAAGVPEPMSLPRPLLWALGGATEALSRLRGVPPAFGRHGIVLLDRRGTVSNEAARKELRWTPEVGLDEGIRRTGEWLRTAGA